MERVSDEWLAWAVDNFNGTCAVGSAKWALEELQARRRAEKEQGHTDISTDDKKPVQAKLKSVKPIPVKRCTIDGVEQDVKECTVKQWFQKINEELDKFKVALIRWDDDDADIAITDEAADTITVITSMLEAMGFDENQRDEAQRRVNEKNRQRGRL